MTAQSKRNEKPDHPVRKTAWIAAALFPFVLLVVCLLSPASRSCSLAEAYAVCIGGFAGISDLKYRRIPNYLTYTAAVAGLMGNLVLSGIGSMGIGSMVNPGGWWEGVGFIGIRASLAGFLLSFLIMLVILVVTGVGAGDAKLAAALGALLGPERGLLLICYAYILAATGSLCVVIVKFGPWRLLRMARDHLMRYYVLRDWPVDSGENRELLQMSVPLGFYFALATPLAILDLPQHLVVN